MHSYKFQLPDHLDEHINRRAAELGISRSEVLRALVQADYETHRWKDYVALFSKHERTLAAASAG